MEHKAQGVATTRGRADKVCPQLFILILHTNELFESFASHSLPRCCDVNLRHSTPPCRPPSCRQTHEVHHGQHHPQAQPTPVIHTATSHTRSRPWRPNTTHRRNQRWWSTPPGHQQERSEGSDRPEGRIWAVFNTARRGVPLPVVSSLQFWSGEEGIPLLVVIYVYFQWRGGYFPLVVVNNKLINI